ncbi:MAG: AAA family ATPase [Fibrobacter sp.]|nr:AAA family ATPase [Fibrobacter sp.]
MAKHFSVRLAWHENGWNGHICQNPQANSYCIGSHSYPGTAVSDNRDIDYEKKHAGEAICKHSCKIACGYSANAFGADSITMLIKKPSWWKPDDAEDAVVTIPPYTACTWQYDAMYLGDVAPDSGSGKYDNNKRFENAKQYFRQFEPGKSLIFYYAGLSNPFSEEDNENFVLVGISRLKEMHDFMYYGNPTQEICEKYANGLVWQKPITSNYPDEGFCIPYWKYANDKDIMEKLVIKPVNREPFKYASREVPADDAIEVVNQFIVAVDTLIQLGDDTENWNVRKSWLSSVLNELWAVRGPFPGLPSVLENTGFGAELVQPFVNLTNIEDVKKFYNEFVELMNEKRDDVCGIKFDGEILKSRRRRFRWLGDEKDHNQSVQKLLLNVLPRIDLSKEQVENIISDNRDRVSITSTHEEILKNPYLIFEQYVGLETDDIISFYKIDNGMIPSPNYGLENFKHVASTERLKALCVDELNRIPAHSFGKAETILQNINERLGRMPDWKTSLFKMKNFEFDNDVWEQGIYQIPDNNGELYLYLEDVYEDERIIEKVFKELAERSDIQLKLPISKEKFIEKLRRDNSSIEKKSHEEYNRILDKQANVCMQIFRKSICVLSGAAGTGKTTVIQALLSNIERINPGTSFLLMAPTGKAAERIKKQTGNEKKSMTIHSFLAKNGWINENFTFKRSKGTKSNDVNTLILDECSMIDLNLFATLVRSINWNSVQRLILIGDPNQLPAIGRGRVFADTIEWLKKEYPDNVGVLTENVRQLVNKIEGNGDGILELANVFIQERQKNEEDHGKSAQLKMEKERIFEKIQLKANGDVDKDLSVWFWKDQDNLENLLKSVMIKDMEKMTGTRADATPDSVNKLWQEVLKGDKQFVQVPERMQIITPYRGEFYGSNSINLLMQDTFNHKWANKFRLEGITIYDKVIQKINRPKSNMTFAYDFDENDNVEAEIYNGEIGIVGPHPFDKKKIHGLKRLQKFCVKFSNESRQNLLYNYGKVATRNKKGKFLHDQSVEENLELAYAISVHKSQGSEFDYVYIIVPKRDSHLLSMELLYTALTRAQKHVTIFLQDDMGTLSSLSQVEKSAVRKINSSVFYFNPLPEVLLYENKWRQDGAKLATLSEYRVRSKSEVIIANMLSEQDIKFEYEKPLYAPDGTMFLPDFTVIFKGEEYYWEHLGMLDRPNYATHWAKKEEWYNKNFPGKLIVTREGNNLSKDAEKIIQEYRF